MKSLNVNYKIESSSIDLALEGETFVGEPITLVNEDVNLIDDLSWLNQGFSVEEFLTPELYAQMQSGLKDMVKQLVLKFGGSVDDKFSLENYHLYVDDEIHLKIAKEIQPGWNVSSFPIDFNLVNERVSQIINKTVTAEAKHLGMYNYFLRIVRPQKFQDNNPPHRDVWIDRLRNAVNIYVPVCGSSQDSSLPLVVGSHLAKESEIERTTDGAKLNGTKYSVPCVISYKGESPVLVRPQINDNQIMVFSPYMIHGGGYNFQKDKTRISLEARFWKN
tara:strand:- start:248 stop:1075 length:828 start_codon:yes stop_codon:yes gene_type:complete